ncbi:MAG: hypothetical protein FWF76_00420 [Oscillospiraceae bacterium]|nr:hypothetical protein [Oscillospiraceae bacterium]
MKNRLKYLLVLFAVSVVVFSKIGGSVFAMSLEEIQRSAMEYFDKERMQNQTQSQLKHDQLMTLLFTAEELELSDFERVYPDFIGGIYYNENDDLVVQIVEGIVPYDSVSKFLSENETIIVENVAFSKNELNTTIEYLNKLFLCDNSPEAFDNVLGFGINTIDNCIDIEMFIYNTNEITHFRENILDSPVFSFIQGSSLVAESGRVDLLSPNGASDGEYETIIRNIIWVFLIPFLLVSLVVLVIAFVIIRWQRKRN